MPDLTSLSVREALTHLRSRTCSSVELTQAHLKRIGQLEPELHAFITLTPELALQAARQADEMRSGSTDLESLPGLLGLPIAIKDLLTLKGVRCTCGSKILEDFKPPYTATTVGRLQNAGVVILGKTNLDEFAMGSSTENSAYGVTRNPWKPSHVPGGSSGGSAAATAARLAPAAVGTDTGGSIRQPASYCGLTGIKPTYGRTSRYGLVAYGSSLDTVGLFARTAEDAAMLLEHAAGHDPMDATTSRLPVPAYTTRLNSDPRGIRIGIPSEFFIKGMQADVEQAVRKAILDLEALGAITVEISLPHTSFALPVYYILATAEASANLARYDGVRFGCQPESASWQELFERSRGKAFGPEVKRRIMLGTYALSAGYYDAYYGQAQKVRRLIRQDFLQAFEKVDVIAAPVAPTTAFKIGEHTGDPLAMYLEDVFTLPANLAGLPGLAFPVGFDAQGLPIGMQLMGRHFEEQTLFNAAHAYQQITDWHKREPQL